MWGELEATCGIRKLFYADVVVSPSVQLKRGKNALNPLTEATKLGRTRQRELGGRIHRWAQNYSSLPLIFLHFLSVCGALNLSFSHIRLFRRQLPAGFPVNCLN